MAAIAISPEVESKISDGSHDGRGQACAFYFVGPRHGIKLYRNENIRNNMYLLQRFFNKFELCPRVCNKIDVGGKYGFITELCDIMDVISGDYMAIMPNIDDNVRWPQKVAYKQYHDAIGALESKVKKCFPYISVYDSHGGNFGFNYETGELNFVDVGHWEIKDVMGYMRRLENLETEELIDIFNFHGLDLLEE